MRQLYFERLAHIWQLWFDARAGRGTMTLAERDNRIARLQRSDTYEPPHDRLAREYKPPKIILHNLNL